MAEFWNGKLKGSPRFTVRSGRFGTCAEKKIYEFHAMVKAAILPPKYDPKRGKYFEDFNDSENTKHPFSAHLFFQRNLAVNLQISVRGTESDQLTNKRQ